MAKCVICGGEFVKPRPNSKPRKSCDNPLCRLELRRITGQQVATKLRANHAAKTILRECLRCGLPFKSEHKFNRLCAGCKDFNRTARTGADYWGAVV